MALINANPDPQIIGEEELPGRSNYLTGNDSSKWRTNIANYGKVRYEEVYEGIDLVYYGNQRKLEYDFIVAPGADYKKILMRFDGVDSLSIDDNGNLVLHTPNGDVVQNKPVVYQQDAKDVHEIHEKHERPGNRQDAKDAKKPLEQKNIPSPAVGRVGEGGYSSPAGRYILLADNQIGFEVDNYDPEKTLVIDPLIYSTYLGGSGSDHGYGIAVDSSGSAYVTGSTQSNNFPTMSGAYKTTYVEPGDVFVTKLNTTGTALIYSTYIGGSGGEVGLSIAVDSSGNAYLAGYTSSTNFPTTVGAFQTTYRGGSNDVFVTKLNPTGTALVYSTYLGGESHENGFSIAVDSSGSAYVTGYTHSNNFPTTGGAYKTVSECGGLGYNFNNDVFVTKLNATGTDLIYSTYLAGGCGGGGDDIGKGIAVDSSGNAYVVGYTEGYTFPVTAGAYMTTHIGYRNAFVTKINVTGTALVYSTFLGKGSTHHGNGIAVDSSGSAHVVGYTANATVDAFQTAFGGGASDTFVVKLNSTGSALAYSTYLGGSGNDFGLGIVLDASGNAHIIGYTSSSDFPTTLGAHQTAFGGGETDAFVAKLNPTGSALAYATYHGGSGNDYGRSIAVDASGNAYIAGGTSSSNFPTTAGAFQTLYGGSDDAFVSKLNLQTHSLNITAGPAGMPNPVVSGGAASFSVEATDSDPDHTLTYAWVSACPDGLGNGSFNNTAIATPVWTAPLNRTGSTVACTVQVTVSDGPGGLTANKSLQENVQSAPPKLTITPTTSMSASGPVGGPFTPASISYTVANTGGGQSTFTVSTDKPWLAVSATAFTLGIDASEEIRVDINGAANSLPVGTHSAVVTFNHVGGPSSTTRTVMLSVADTTPPVITAPVNVTAEATGVLTQVALGSAMAIDNVTPSSQISITNDAPVGGFPIGATAVVWTAKDAAGNIATAVQTVTVKDTTPPVVTAPADVTAQAKGQLTFVDIGQAVAADTIGVVSLANDAPANGYPVGTTVVTWSATDVAGNIGRATQSVIVSQGASSGGLPSPPSRPITPPGLARQAR